MKGWKQKNMEMILMKIHLCGLYLKMVKHKKSRRLLHKKDHLIRIVLKHVALNLQFHQKFLIQNVIIHKG